MNLFCPKRKYKHVSFNMLIDVIIIPNSMYEDNPVKIWWSNSDIFLFKESCSIEIMRLLHIHPKMRISDALKLLYQPPNSTIVFNEKNFD